PGQALTQQARQQGLGHVATADKCNLTPNQHGAIIRTALRPAQLATAGRGCYRVTTSVTIRDLQLIGTHSEIALSSPWKCRRSEPGKVTGSRQLEHQANPDIGSRAVGRTGYRGFIAAPVLTIILLLSLVGTGQAQVMGEEAELDRLRAKAEEAMGNDDAESAAMSMGRAALMAAQLAK